MTRGKHEPKIMASYNEKHEEVLDSRPVDAMLSRKKPETLQQMVARLVRNNEMQRDLSQNGFETFDEANDFDCGDDYDPTSPYEEQFQAEEMLYAEHKEAIREQKRLEAKEKVKKEIIAKRKKATEALPASKPKSKKPVIDED